MTIDWPETQRIYLSPHLDDVILSCGGTVYIQSKQGKSVAVVSIFAASPPSNYKLSPLARQLHERWQASAPVGVDFSDPPQVRREEDCRSFSWLDPRIQVIHLPIPESIYRMDGENWLYDSEEEIFGDIQPGDPAVGLLQKLGSPPPLTTVYAPLGIGHHVDHLLAYEWVHTWTSEDVVVRYYEDYPYAGDPEVFDPGTLIQKGWIPMVVELGGPALEAKIRAIAAHQSQISTFWDGVDSMASKIRGYAARVGGERYWIKPGAQQGGRA
nr:PIG-L family deacetylase [Anaerolineae bacterium]